MAESKMECEIAIKLDFTDIKEQLQNLLKTIEAIENENVQSKSEQHLTKNTTEKILEIVDAEELNYNELTLILERVKANFLDLAIIPQKRKASREDRK